LKFKIFKNRICDKFWVCSQIEIEENDLLKFYTKPKKYLFFIIFKIQNLFPGHQTMSKSIEKDVNKLRNQGQKFVKSLRRKAKYTNLFPCLTSFKEWSSSGKRGCSFNKTRRIK